MNVSLNKDLFLNLLQLINGVSEVTNYTGSILRNFVLSVKILS